MEAGLIVSAWRRHNDITLLLISKIPKDGFDAVPLNSRGRTVREQFVHMYQVRLGWLYYHETGKRLRKADLPAENLTEAFRESGREVGDFLTRALEGEARIRMFGKDPVRWYTYLIEHEAHHRGQIMLALKQAGMRMPDPVAMQGLWGKWFYGK